MYGQMGHTLQAFIISLLKHQYHCLKSLLCFFDNKLFHSYFIYDEKNVYKTLFLSFKL